jgi:hypothetical protein
MSLKEIKDKLEIGLKPDAPYRPTNLPESQQPHAAHPAGTDPVPDDGQEASHEHPDEAPRPPEPNARPRKAR